MVFGPSGRDRDSRNQLYSISQTGATIFHKIQEHTKSFWEILLGEFKKIGTVFEQLKRWGPNNPEDPLNTFGKSDNL